MIYTVYMITNDATGKKYVGVTKNLRQRLFDHKSRRPHLLEGGYTVTEMACALDKVSGGAAEAAIIAQEETLEPTGYNILTGGFVGRQMPQWVRDKIGALAAARPSAWVGRQHSKAARKRMSKTKKAMFKAGTLVPHMKGKRHTDEVKAKISASKVGKSPGRPGKRTPEQVARMVEAQRKSRAKNPHRKKSPPLSPEARQKISQSLFEYNRRRKQQ